MNNFEVKPIGTIRVKEEGTFLELEPQYIPALKGLEGFSHLEILWWFSDFDGEEYRSIYETEQPYKGAPAVMGIFATRSPIRPNPIALTASPVIRIDEKAGFIELAYHDANDGTPVLDIKPYTPSADRVESPEVPKWCGHWPKSLEESGDFAWEEVFNF